MAWESGDRCWSTKRKRPGGGRGPLHNKASDTNPRGPWYPLVEMRDEWGSLGRSHLCRKPGCGQARRTRARKWHSRGGRKLVVMGPCKNRNFTTQQGTSSRVFLLLSPPVSRTSWDRLPG